MGLDMYAFARTKEGEMTQIQYWRKHPNLHGWMEELWEKRGRPVAKELSTEEDCPEVYPADQSFNCVQLRLTPTDIDDLEKAVNEETLPETVGFFFGQSLPEDKELDLEFIAKAREAFAHGDDVYYDSWW